MRLYAFKGHKELAQKCAQRARRTNHADMQALAYRLDRARVVRETLLACGVYV